MLLPVVAVVDVVVVVVVVTTLAGLSRENKMATEEVPATEIIWVYIRFNMSTTTSPATKERQKKTKD